MTPSTPEMGEAVVDPIEPAIEHDGQLRQAPLQAMHTRMVERRDVAVLLRRQTLEPRLARMHDEHRATGFAHDVDETVEVGLGILLIDADAALHRDRNRHRRTHRREAFRHQRRFAHEAGAETSRLHAIGRTTDIEVDLVVAETLADPRRLRQLGRLGTAELQGHRMLARIEAEQPLAIAVDHRRRGDHLGVQARMRRQRRCRSVQSIIGQRKAATDRYWPPHRSLPCATRRLWAFPKIPLDVPIRHVPAPHRTDHYHP